MIGKVLDNRYELVEFVGKGGTALVYRAIDQRTGHSVAVKILRPEISQDPEASARFEREAMAASKMNHHNIANLLDVGQDGDLRYLVMEFVRGTLKDVIQQKGALPPGVAAQICIRILSALQHAHKNGIIHRDIKPQNILVNTDGHVKVADFGIARVAGSNTITSEDSVMGSVHYFSPEQARNQNVTAASDLYSVGVVLYEMLTGQPPFDGDNPVAIAMKHLSDTPRPISELNPAVPPAMERVVAKAMEKKPENRYQSALEMAQDLQRAMQEPDGTWLGRLPDKQPPQKPKQSAPTSTNTGRQSKVSTHSARWVWTRVGIVGVISLVMIGLIYGAIAIYDQVVNTTEAPYCLDEQETDALRLINRAGLIYEVSRVSDPVKPSGTVIMQSPQYGSAMRKGETVFLTISTGPEEQEVPLITDMNVESARTELERTGFTLLALPRRELSSAAWDTVLSQLPEAGEMLASGGVVQVTLSGGSVRLPNLIGLSRQEALLQIEQLQLRLTEIKEIPVEDEALFDQVTAQKFSDASTFEEYEVGDLVMQQTLVELAIFVSAHPSEDSPEASATPYISQEELGQ